jgi:hypothetical protein
LTCWQRGRPSSESAVINEGAAFTYIYYTYRDHVKAGQVNFAIYREGEVKPIEGVTYYLENYRRGAPVEVTLEATQ